jgi:hypothetical protein
MRTPSDTSALFAGPFFRLRINFDPTPEGPELACLDLPGSIIRLNMNIELRILGLRALLGHITIH